MKIITKNKKAFFDYEILQRLEAGIVLSGDEVKSLRQSNISLGDAFATFHDSELFLINAYIAPYKQAFSKKDKSRRSRKLLLHKKELNKLVGDISKKGLTIVPLKVYINKKGLIKIELGVAKHKKAHSKKRIIKERDIKREIARTVKIKIK